MFLTERQQSLLIYLLSVDDYIATKVIATKFQLSLRTIRYDLENIECYLNNNNIELLKKPKKGVMIDDKQAIRELIAKDNIEINQVVLSNDTREFFIIIKFIKATRYITAEELGDEFLLSKGTILSSIKNINEKLKTYSIKIQGKTNYGFKLIGEEENIRNYISYKIITFIVESDLKDKLISNLSKEFNFEFKEVLENLYNIFKLNLTTYDEKKFILEILFFIIRNKTNNLIKISNEEIKRYRKVSIYKKMQQIYIILIDDFQLPYKEEEIIYLIKRIVNYDINNALLEEGDLAEQCDDKLLNVVSYMVDYLYGKININEDEIGFITMYICKAIENSKLKIKRNVFVICNTGRGAAKLLATRLKNNIPEINVIKVTSISNIKNSDLTEIDLVISTIPINNIHKKVILVSPIITSYELSTIREYLYLNENNHEC